jgi:hypothetical protein
VLSVTTFWSFLREFSPLEVHSGGIRHFLKPRPRVSVDVAGLHRKPPAAHRTSGAQRLQRLLVRVARVLTTVGGSI